MAVSALRRDWLSKPLFRWAAKALPTMSDTEREAIEAGDIWWDAELFTGNPAWRKLLDTPPARLTDEERAFLDGPVTELCAMVDDWRINWELHDLPPDIWAFLKARKFFGMIIPRKYGGLGFSAYAHSEVVRRISTRSLTTAVTVMVPNSLGPGELLLHFGTDAQRDYWLPRLADGREIPCFGLTSPEAGSDAASMVDRGEVCKGTWQGREVLGIRLNWHKRYITLGPVATVLGLAFKLYDPGRLLGDREELGITVALVPTDTPGVEIGRRHIPAMQVFQNGPNRGREVFIPLESIIGGVERAGQGWQMLMTALAAGRGISLPSLAAASCAFSAHTSGAYARVRQQFGIPIGKFEGVQEKLGRMAALAYQVDAARRLTCAGLDAGHKPAVISAIMKYHATERMRIAVNDAMDVHAGKGVIDGPRNYLSNVYRAIPIGITVEGANILTRCLIVFGQGAIRAHPFLMQEMSALADPDTRRGLEEFDRTFWRHAGHAAANALRAFARAWTDGRFAPAPRAVGATAGYYRQLNRYASAFALVADVTLATLGGALKRKEMLSARLGDILAELYLLSAVLKRWHDEGRQADDLPLVQWCMESGLATIEERLDAVLANLPARAAAGLLRFICLPWGVRRRGPSDALTQACAALLLEPSPARDRLLPGLARPRAGEALDHLARAFELAAHCAPVLDELRRAGIKDWREGAGSGALDSGQAAMLEEMERVVAEVVEVDSFAAADLAGRHATARCQPDPGE
ncbi:acyl-CoA dehydrogenase [Pigmentiphaga sp. NML080357]|uniref:acyl-CoA dehydrogenase n=1 Tax=Pigmentiphaga sp. NML080357 TaxID=2008675 RepID=UPI000B412451|nr:acyl-CoA dehydrogenase [Pigmentiphaga sp. NML080357]OVZ57136.1 acyl-CoA dehydrogenase [Pigmentiphaga sp. NML080357]